MAGPAPPRVRLASELRAAKVRSVSAPRIREGKDGGSYISLVTRKSGAEMVTCPRCSAGQSFTSHHFAESCAFPGILLTLNCNDFKEKRKTNIY